MAAAPVPQAFNIGSFQARDGYNSFPPAQYPPGFNQKQAAEDAVFDAIDLNHDGKITKEEMDAFNNGGAGKYGSAMHTTTAGGAYLSGQQTNFEEASIYADAVDIIDGAGHVVAKRLVDQRQQVISGVRPIFTFEKVVEIPKTIIKEYETKVVKPQLIERIIEVPKMETRERTFVGPPSVQYQEQIVEVPQVVFEERVVHVPRKEIQERLIEVPKVEYVERIEYDDFVEYREVLVDKIIEVPEIEYHIREVEHLVPQNYVQEYFVDKYVEQPVTSIQEVARVEQIPIGVQQTSSVQGGGGGGCVSASFQQPAVAAPVVQTYSPRANPAPPTGVTQVMPATSVTPVAPPTARPMQGITVAVPRGTLGPSRTTVDGGQLFQTMDTNHDGTISANEALTAISILTGKQLAGQAAPPSISTLGQSAQAYSQSYGSYDPNTAGSAYGYNPSNTAGSAYGYNPYSSSFAAAQSLQTPPATAMPMSGYGSATVPGTSMTPPTPPVPYGQPVSQTIPRPVSVY
jgi:hypothetical protein